MTTQFHEKQKPLNSILQMCTLSGMWIISQCSHEIKRCILLGRKAITNSMLKSRHVTLPTKLRRVKAISFPVVMYRRESWTIMKAEHRRMDALNCGAGEDSWESLEQQGNQTSRSLRKSTLNIHWKDWCWSWGSSSLGHWCEEQTHWKGPWSQERLKVGGEGDDRGWAG